MINALKRKKFNTRDEWLSARNNGIGASEAAKICGFSKWGNAVSLWKEKIGLAAPKDISGKDFIQRGNKMEPILRDFFSKTHEQFALQYKQYEMIFQKERPWLFATLDGELTERETGKRGILEIKTGNATSWDEWKNGLIPQQYYVQTLHQLLATGFDFVFVFALLYHKNGDMSILEREVWRESAKEDMEWLLQEETEFWRMVTSGIMPNNKLTI